MSKSQVLQSPLIEAHFRLLGFRQHYSTWQHAKLGTIYFQQYAPELPWHVNTLEGSKLTTVRTLDDLLLFIKVITGEEFTV